MRTRRSIGGVVAGVVVAVAAWASPAAAATPTTGAIFNDPLVAGEQRVIVDHIIGLIDGTPAGEEISISMYAFDETPVANALIAAKNRGVRVRVVLDSTYAGRTPALALANSSTGLGTNTSATSWVKVCATDYACVSGAPTSVNPINHNKFYLFSQTNGANRVLVQSSANLTANNTVNYWNNAVTIVDNGPIYDAYRAYFVDLAAARHDDSNYYRMTSSGIVKSYFFPRAGTTSSTDTIVEILNNVTCAGNDAGWGTVDGYTKIRIAAWKITREDIAYKLRSLASQNCWVDIVYASMSSGSITALNHPRIKTYLLNDGSNLVHSKYMLIEGTYAGQKNTKWVFTGSHNYDDSSLRENDEALLRIQSNTIHDQYRTNFWDIRAVAQA